MKLSKIILISIFVMFTALNICAQTAITTNGARDPGTYYTTYTFAGTVARTDTSNFATFQLGNHNAIIDLQYTLTNAHDSARIYIDRQESYFSNKWTVKKILLRRIR